MPYTHYSFVYSIVYKENRHMNAVTVKIAGQTYKRVSKASARRMFAQGIEIGLCPAKFMPSDYGWVTLSHISLERVRANDYHESARDAATLFDSTVNEYEYYNANCNEAGHYAAYYIAAK